MEVAISTKKLYRILYWILYVGLCFISGWFALNSGVIDHYISRTTSFAQLEEKSTKRPVISINLETKELPVLNTNIWIYYTQSYKLWPNPNLTNLIMGENDFLIREINETEKVFFHQNKFYYSFRIIPLTGLLEERAKAFMKIVTEKSFDPKIFIYLTSLGNSVGSPLVKFKDGDSLYYELEKNSFKKFLIKPEKYNFLQETAKCHQESYHDCLAMELDKFDFNQTSCKTKCIPAMFSFGRNYSTPFCTNLTDNKCAVNIFSNFSGKIENNFTQNVNSKCKHSCTILQYSGSVVLWYWHSTSSKHLHHDLENFTYHEFEYQFGNADNKMNAFHEYLIYDTMGMIGSVGGFMGIFIGFSMTSFISFIIELFKERKIGRNILV